MTVHSTYFAIKSLKFSDHSSGWLIHGGGFLKRIIIVVVRVEENILSTDTLFKVLLILLIVWAWIISCELSIIGVVATHTLELERVLS